MVLELEAGPQAVLELRLAEPVAQSTTTRLGDLVRGSHNLRTGPFPKESYQWHRLVPLAASALSGKGSLELDPRRKGYAYLRARQTNGHLAWASPVFLNYR